MSKRRRWLVASVAVLVVIAIALVAVEMFWAMAPPAGTPRSGRRSSLA